LAYLKNSSKIKEEYEKWASQFEEKYNHIYQGERRIVPKGEVE